MAQYYTTGQVARELRISVSTLKRWLSDETVLKKSWRNAAGWRLFTTTDVEALRNFKKEKKKNGKKFKPSTLRPV